MGPNKIILTVVLVLSIAAAVYLGVHDIDKMTKVEPDDVQKTGVNAKVVLPSEDQTHQSSIYNRTTVEPNPLITTNTVDLPFENVDIGAFKKTSLHLKLWGTITGNNVRAFAIIEETTNRKQKLYREGDVIQNAVVKRILRGKVILSVDGKLEMLDIETKRADVNAKNKYGVTALIDASFRGQKEVVELLIVEGADLDAQDNKGDTALMNAAIKGHIEIVELLVMNGADVHIQDNSGNTALIDSAKYARKSTCDVIGFLIDSGADVNDSNNYGATALMNAAQWGHLKNVDCLIAEGANINVTSKSGETAIKLAELSKYEAVVELLKKHGGNRW